MGRMLPASRPAVNDGNGPEDVIEFCRSTVRTRANPDLNEELQFSVTLRIFQKTAQHFSRTGGWQRVDEADLARCFVG